MPHMFGDVFVGMSDVCHAYVWLCDRVHIALFVRVSFFRMYARILFPFFSYTCVSYVVVYTNMVVRVHVVSVFVCML